MKFYAGTGEAAAENDGKLYYKFPASPTKSIKYDFTVYVLFISNFAVLEYGGCAVLFTNSFTTILP